MESRFTDALIAASARGGCPTEHPVERENTAMRSYQRLGFEQVEDRGLYAFMTRSP